ncbi:MAG: hydroxymethylbilane synthase [Bacteroidetes bacterium]|nr:hydroxymethylbilane synthase [Bacteroidota bacterium]
MRKKVIIGTRGSKLALWQANFTKDKLEDAGFQVDIHVIKTKGDQIQHLSFDKLEGKGFFTKEIEDALLAKEVDLAVHSCKDMPTESPEGLTIAAFSTRVAPNDVMLIRKDASAPEQFLEFRQNALVGTSSARRKAQLKALRPDIELKDIRGNVPTRINKLREGQFDVILLAAAGLDRLNLDTGDLIRMDLPVNMFVPAPAQGILAYQVRSSDEGMAEVIEILNDPVDAEIAHAERSILEAFQGGCQMPLGIYARQKGDVLNMWVSKAATWDAVPVRMHFQAEDGGFDNEAILDKLDNIKPCSVFISRKSDESDYFTRTLNTHGFKLKGAPLIAFRPMEFNVDLEEFDWLFFTSKNGVRYFFESLKEIPLGLRIGTINSGTAGIVRKYGHVVDFCGKGGSLGQIAAAFDATTGNKVLFARAETSNRSIQKALSGKTITDVIVYHNYMVSDIEERKEDILVFTSPMNADNYFSRYTPSAAQSVVAIGNSTASTIRKYGVDCRVSYDPTAWSLTDVAFGLAAER